MKQRGEVVEVSHREFIKDLGRLTVPNDYSVAFFEPINPGNATLFPWLSPMAMRFEMYRFKKLKFEFQSFLSTATVGAVYLAVDFDAQDPSPTTKTQLLSYKGVERSNVWASFSMDAGKSDMNAYNKRYCQDEPLGANVDAKTVNVGNFIAAIDSSIRTAGTFGELWVEYTIELFTPQIASPSGGVSIAPQAGVPSAQLTRNATVISAPSTDVTVVPDGVVGSRLRFNRDGQYALAGTTGVTGTVTPAYGNLTLNDIVGTAAGVPTITPQLSGFSDLNVSSGIALMSAILGVKKGNEFNIGMGTVGGSGLTIPQGRIDITPILAAL